MVSFFISVGIVSEPVCPAPHRDTLGRLECAHFCSLVPFCPQPQASVRRATHTICRVLPPLITPRILLRWSSRRSCGRRGRFDERGFAVGTALGRLLLEVRAAVRTMEARLSPASRAAVIFRSYIGLAATALGTNTKEHWVPLEEFFNPVDPSGRSLNCMLAHRPLATAFEARNGPNRQNGFSLPERRVSFGNTMLLVQVPSQDKAEI